MIADPARFENWRSDDTPERYAARILEESKGQLFILGDSDTSELLVYDPECGIFTPGERVVKRRIKTLLKPRVRISQIKEIFNLVHLDAPQKIASEFDKNLSFITFSNGVLNVQEDKLLQFSPTYMSRTRIPNQCDAEAACPVIDGFLEEVVSLEYHPLIEELLGCCLTGDVRFEKCLFVTGPGNNGKSVFLKLAQAMVGSENTVNIPLQELVDRHYSRAELYRKRLNAFADIDYISPKELGILKVLISGDPIPAERKYQDPFSFTNSAVMIFSCNRLPHFRQKDYSVRKRFIVIPFPKQFEGDDRNENLISELTTPQEISGLINRATAGYRRLLQNGCFSVPEESERILDLHFKWLDSAWVFIEESTVDDPNARTAKTELYSAYQAYCLNRSGDLWAALHLRPLSRNKFSREVRCLRPWIREGKMSSSDRRDAWIGIRVREEKEYGSEGDPKA